ncbi:hypothetical protein HA402_005888 [Bradysia odoriphaga]|nr:hypothetical protein HA402_005888 [Bradysia odoriphaga]
MTNYPKMICFRCEEQLQNAFHFRQLAESSSKHFAAIHVKNSPRILNSSQQRNGVGKLLATGKQWIKITNQNSRNIDVTLKSETANDEEKTTSTSPDVYNYTVNIIGDDGNIEVRPRRTTDNKSSSSVNTKRSTPTLSSEVSSDVVEIDYVSDNAPDEQSDSDAISFLLNNKHLKKNDEDSKSSAYSNRKYECTVCTKKFVGKSNLVDHLRYHANIRNYKCTFCDKSFVQSGSLKSHLRTHSNEKPYICSYCNKGFGQKSALTVHIRTHTNERKFVCDTCSKAFMTAGDLVKHKLIHESIKKFACDVCGMRSAQKVNVKKHRLKVHGLSEDNVFPVEIHASNAEEIIS